MRIPHETTRQLTVPALVRGPLSALEGQLDPERYLRIHRSLIVSLDRVQEIEPYSACEFVLYLRSGQRLISGRTHKKQVQRAFGIRA
jgi:two-component system, LytTR family, response regulator